MKAIRRRLIRWLLIVLAVACGYLAAHYAAVLMSRPMERRAWRRSTFFAIGRKLAQELRESGVPASTVWDLRSKGWLSAAEWGFIRSNAVLYTPPRRGLSDDQVILRMPSEGQLDYVVELNGSMTTESKK